MKTELASLLNLSSTEKLQIIGALWDSLNPEDVEIPEWQQQELDRRLTDAEQSPDLGESWAVVKERIRQRHNG
jgi:putative addiction module component (TIGR02574 family)